MGQQTPLEQLRLPPEKIRAIKAAGITCVEELCAKRLMEVGEIVGRNIDDIKAVRVALSELGLDIQRQHEDPVGSPNTPSRKAFRSLLDRLDLLPRTRERLTLYLLSALSRREVLATVEPEDRDTIERLFELMIADDGWQNP